MGVLCRLFADLGHSSCTQALGDVGTNVNLDVRVGDRELLGVGVDGNELNTTDALLDHAVHGIGAAAADADDLDDCKIIAKAVVVCHSRTS